MQLIINNHNYYINNFSLSIILYEEERTNLKRLYCALAQPYDLTSIEEDISSSPMDIIIQIEDDQYEFKNYTLEGINIYEENSQESSIIFLKKINNEPIVV